MTSTSKESQADKRKQKVISGIFVILRRYTCFNLSGFLSYIERIIPGFNPMEGYRIIRGGDAGKNVDWWAIFGVLKCFRLDLGSRQGDLRPQIRSLTILPFPTLHVTHRDVDLSTCRRRRMIDSCQDKGSDPRHDGMRSVTSHLWQVLLTRLHRESWSGFNFPDLKPRSWWLPKLDLR